MTSLPTRRDRLRGDALAQIKDVARQQLIASGPAGIHLRAIAREMGMTAPGLYRYFASRDELVTALIVDCYDEVIGEMERARDALEPGDLIGRLLAVSRAFRTWSVRHPAEFQLIFGAPPPGYSTPPEGPAEEAGTRFGGVFLGIFAEIWMRRAFHIPAESDLDPVLLDQLQSLTRVVDPRLPAGARYRFLACWVRLYGAVAMEVFGHMQWAVDEGGGFYETELRQLSGLLGMAEEYRRPATA